MKSTTLCSNSKKTGYKMAKNGYYDTNPQGILPFDGTSRIQAEAYPRRFLFNDGAPDISDRIREEYVPGWLEAHDGDSPAHSESHVHFGGTGGGYADMTTEPREGFIYFISNGNGQVKIGKSKHPGARLKNLQTASPYALKLALTLESDDMAGDEAYYHQQFAKDRVSENSEWFRYSRGLKQFMESENESR